MSFSQHFLSLIAFSVTLATTCLFAQDEPANTKLDVQYKENGKLKMDLYYPVGKSSGHYPVVIYTHGGGWAAGSKQSATKSSMGQVVSGLTERGFCVAAVEYRLARNGNATIHDCVTDCKDALRYLAKNRDALLLDMNCVSTFGDSAGGHLAQMLLLTPKESFPGDPELASTEYRLVAGVSWYGPCDFENIDLFNHDDRADFRDRFATRILGSDAENPNKLIRYREVSPVNYLTKDSPPLLMIQGDKDTTIPVKHAYHMQQKAEAIGAPVEIMIIKNSGHNWRNVDSDMEPSREEIIDLTLEFLVEHQ